MNIIISFAGLDNRQSSAPYALRRLAGGNVVGHNLARLFDLPIEKLIVVVDSGVEEVGKWIRTNAPTFPLHMVHAMDAVDPISSLVSCSTLVDNGQLIFISGNYIVGTTYEDLVASPFDAACLVQRDQEFTPSTLLPVDESGKIAAEETGNLARWAGSFWLRNGLGYVKTLDALGSLGTFDIDNLLVKLANQGVPISTWQARYCLDTRSNEDMLRANARLLHLDYGTQDSIERSYAEDFTVLPPVFMHETAVIENSVIGPFVNLEANALVRNSIVRNSLIGKGTRIIDAILENSLIGDDAKIAGLKRTVIAEDGADVRLNDKSNKPVVKT